MTFFGRFYGRFEYPLEQDDHCHGFCNIFCYINNDTSFKLADGSINDGYLLRDGLHLSKQGTNRLVRNLSLKIKSDHVNDVTKPAWKKSLKANETDRSQNAHQKHRTHKTNQNHRNLPQHQDPQYGCKNCGEYNHSSSNCRHGKRLQCHSCERLGHKSKFCWAYSG